MPTAMLRSPIAGENERTAAFEHNRAVVSGSDTKPTAHADVRALFEQVRYALICHKPGDMETG